MSQRYTHAVIETIEAAVEKLSEANAAVCPIFPRTLLNRRVEPSRLSSKSLKWLEKNW